MQFESTLKEKTVAEIVKEHFVFTIPYQQRGYRWRVRNVLELLWDLLEFMDGTSCVYCLQPLAVSKTDGSYRVWDGQQRLTTLFLLFKALGLAKPYEFVFDRDKDGERAKYMDNPDFDDSCKKRIDNFYIGRAYALMNKCLRRPSTWESINIVHEQDKELFDKIRQEISRDGVSENLKKLLTGELVGKRLEFLWYEIDEIIAPDIFRDINSGKISLTNSELIKALLLSERSKIKNKELAAAQFFEIEKGMLDDKFWYMIQAYESKVRNNRVERVDNLTKGEISLQSKLMRMDLLFNMEAGISYEAYQDDAIASFRYFYDNRDRISELWDGVRRKYQILRAIFTNIETYHIVGYVTYCKRSQNYKSVTDLIRSYSENRKSEFLANLKKTIKFKNPSELDFNKDKEEIRRVLLLHNITTILHNFARQRENTQLHLERPFEIFPFELLYRQKWNVEHIAPATDNNLTKESDREEWISSVKTDYPDLFPGNYQDNDKKSIGRFAIEDINDIAQKLELYHDAECRDEKDKTFNALYESVVNTIDNYLGDDSVKQKYSIGNYVLLDESTNKSFHNSLFPTKRRIIISATGQQVNELAKQAKLVYIPPCTRAAFMKFYTTSPHIAITEWTETDSMAYKKNIEDLLKDYVK